MVGRWAWVGDCFDRAGRSGIPGQIRVRIPVTPGNGRIESGSVNASDLGLSAARGDVGDPGWVEPGGGWPRASRGRPRRGGDWRGLVVRCCSTPTRARSRWLVLEQLLPGIIAFSAAGAVLIMIRPARLVGWLLMASAVLNAASVLAAGLWYLSFQEAWTFATLLNASFATVPITGWLAYILLPQLFPDGVLRGWLWRALLVVSVLLLVAQFALYALTMVLELSKLLGGSAGRAGQLGAGVRSVPRLSDLMIAIAVVALLERLRRGPGNGDASWPVSRRCI